MKCAGVNKAIARNPKYVDARVQLGWFLANKSDFSGATKWFVKTLRRDPASREAHKNWSWVLADSEFPKNSGIY